jgi:hypothetical protein
VFVARAVAEQQASSHAKRAADFAQLACGIAPEVDDVHREGGVETSVRLRNLRARSVLYLRAPHSDPAPQAPARDPHHHFREVDAGDEAAGLRQARERRPVAAADLEDRLAGLRSERFERRPVGRPRLQRHHARDDLAEPAARPPRLAGNQLRLRHRGGPGVPPDASPRHR